MIQRCLAFVQPYRETKLGRLFEQFFKFGLVGLVSFAVDAIVLLIAAPFVGPYWGRVISYLVAATNGWILNRHFTFKGEHKDPMVVQWLKFLLLNTPGMGVNYGTYAVLLNLYPWIQTEQIFLVAAVFAGSVMGMFVNFTFNKLFVFK